MKILRLISVVLVLAVACSVVFMITKSKTRKTADNYYAMQITRVDAETGAFHSTYDIAIETEKQLRDDAHNESLSGETVFIGCGSTSSSEPVTEIKLAGVGGEVYGQVSLCSSE